LSLPLADWGLGTRIEPDSSFTRDLRTRYELVELSRGDKTLVKGFKQFRLSFSCDVIVFQKKKLSTLL